MGSLSLNMRLYFEGLPLFALYATLTLRLVAFDSKTKITCFEYEK